MILFAAVLMISFAACGGNKKADQPAEVVEVEVIEETVVPQEQATYVEPTPAEALKAFQAFAKEYAEAFNNIAKDPKKFSELANQMQQKVADMERIKVDLNDKQLKEYTKAMELISKVNTGGK